ncbi:MAG: hypothetical protein IKA02_05200, partial [Clostridia bacterium]|nr:hypothetical protein [Clostridia bacterium]
METTEKLIKYAIYKDVLFDESGEISSVDDFDLETVKKSKEKIRFAIKVDDKNKDYYDVDFSTENQEKTNFIKDLRKMLPMVEIIDLIYLANTSRVNAENDATLVVDETEDDAFLSYQNDYIKLTENSGFFKFRFDGDSEIYNITFKEGANDITNNIDLAARSAPFVDILIKKIMSSYNVLVVTKASYELNIKREPPIVAKGFNVGKANYDDVEGATSKLQSRMRVLIRYRDIVNNQTFSETVVDDIDVTFKDDSLEPEFDYFDIVPGKSEAIYGTHKNVNIDEIKNIVKVKNYMDKKSGKHEVFSVLRDRENSNLKKLIDSRIPMYEKAYEKSKVTPRIEFTLTPITIFSNRIAVKKVKYPISAEIAGCKVKSEYEFEFDPMSDAKIEYKLKVGDEDLKIDKDNPLVLAVTNNFVVDKLKKTNQRFSNVTTDYVKVAVGCKESTINLYEENPKYYGTETYKGIYFDKSQIVRYSDKTSNLADEYKKEDLPFLKTDMQKCQVSGKCYFYNFGEAKRSDMTRMSRNKVIEEDVNGLKGYKISQETKKCFVVKSYVRKCSYCGEDYAALPQIWSEYADEHKIINLKEKHCCEKCASQQEENKEGKFILLDPRGFYFETDGKMNDLAYCPVCKANGSDEYLYTGNTGGRSELKKCSVCNQYCCKKHMTQINKKDVCNLCSGKISEQKMSRKLTKFNLDDDKHKKLWSMVKPYLNLLDRDKEKCKFIEMGNELYLYCYHEKYVRVYYFW